MTTPSQKQVWSEAKRLLSLGISIIPCKRNKRPDSATWKEYTVRKPYKSEVDSWFKPDIEWEYDRTSQSIGVVCGKISDNLVVVDLDGIAAIRQFAAKFPKLCEQTKSVLTGSQEGIHLYFKVKTMSKNANVRVAGVGGFELRGDGQYVIAPPSPHESGYYYRTYRDNPILQRENMTDVFDWMQSLRENEQEKRQAEIAKAAQGVLVPVASKGHSRSKTAFLRKVVSEEIARVTTSGNGNRNNSLFYAACRLANYAAGGELNWSEMESLLLLATDLPMKSAKATVASAYRIGSKRPKRVKS